jgi:adenosine deaminase
LTQQTLLDRIHQLPKVELHRHLEGSMRIETLLQVARENDRELANITLEELRPHVQMVPGQPFTAQEFLSKFKVLRQFYNSPETIRRIARECVEDAARDNIRYMELRFTPKALTNVLHCSYTDVMDWVCATVAETADKHDIDVRLIVSMNRHESVSIGEEVLEVALAYQDQGVVGLDLAGAEADFPGTPFKGIFQKARAAGLFTTVHAGEWGGAENVIEAVADLGADRIGHGIRSGESEECVKLLKEHGTVLEVCPTSNLHSGVAADLNQHPLVELYRAGVKTTINTDDPLISNVTLTTEILDVMFNMKFDMNDIQQNILHAAQGAFLPDDERKALVARFEGWFAEDNDKAN